MPKKIILVSIFFVVAFVTFQTVQSESPLLNHVFAQNNIDENNGGQCIPIIINHTAYDFETMSQKFQTNQFVLIKAYMKNCQTNTPFFAFTKIFHQGNLVKETWTSGIQSINKPDPKTWWTGLIEASFVPLHNGIYEIEISILDDLSNRNKLSPEKRFSIVVGGTSNTASDVEQTQIIESENLLNEKTTRNVPEWVRNIALWYGEDSLSQSEFVNALQYLINQKIINVPVPDSLEHSTFEHEQKVPEWVKNTAKWYGQGKISEGDFVLGIQYLINNGMIIV